MTKYSDKGKILKAPKEKKTVMYKGNPLSLPVCFSAGTFQPRNEWHDRFKVWQGKICSQEYSIQQN